MLAVTNMAIVTGMVSVSRTMMDIMVMMMRVAMINNYCDDVHDDDDSWRYALNVRAKTMMMYLTMSGCCDF